MFINNYNNMKIANFMKYYNYNKCCDEIPDC